MQELLFLAVGLVVGGGVGCWMAMAGRKGVEKGMEALQKELAATQIREKAVQEEKIALIRECERLKESMRFASREAERQKAEHEEARRLMTEQFKNLATEILEDKSRRFTESNRENIEKILQPLNQDIREFRKQVDEAYHKESTERTLLERKIAELVQLNNQIRIDAAQLTQALKGDSKTQGDWGEMILERILENSGLTKGREYFVQETLRDEAGEVVKDENGNAMRPDVIVVYPDKRRVVIDSKVSLTAYMNYCNAEEVGDKKAALQAHLQSVRRHIAELAEKNYCHWTTGSLDFVMMFIPNESSYVLAMQADSSLWAEAYKKRILLLSPANLIVSLKLTADLWSREYQNRNAQEIAERGAKLYDKCVAFLESFMQIGEHIQRTQDAYEQALMRLKEGNGNLITQTLKLKELGIKSRKGEKEIPHALRNDTGVSGK